MFGFRDSKLEGGHRSRRPGRGIVRLQLNQSEPLSPLQSSQALPPGPRRDNVTRPLPTAGLSTEAGDGSVVVTYQRRGGGGRNSRTSPLEQVCSA